jgi:hypothetical protein
MGAVVKEPPFHFGVFNAEGIQNSEDPCQKSLWTVYRPCQRKKNSDQESYKRFRILDSDPIVSPLPPLKTHSFIASPKPNQMIIGDHLWKL